MELAPHGKDGRVEAERHQEMKAVVYLKGGSGRFIFGELPLSTTSAPPK
jgi:hypothetical protein